jgi:hypothetical protein
MIPFYRMLVRLRGNDKTISYAVVIPNPNIITDLPPKKG